MFVLAVVAAVASASTATCDSPDPTNAAALRKRAAEHYTSGEVAAADACVASALVAITSELELLAAQAQALRSFRAARQSNPTVVPSSGVGCVVDATGATVCLPELGAARASQAKPTTAAECGSEESALALLASPANLVDQHNARLVSASGSNNAGGAANTNEVEAVADDAAASAPLDAFIMQAAQRHWWTAAKKAVDLLRAQNVPPGADARRAVTELRDGAGSVLALMRQTKMDEATISCAVMWAQGLYSVHLNVKFASRLDAPVTVLNVDNEEVTITETRVTFSGVGRQKPKRYVIDLELFAPIDVNASSWSFGSVGTIRFQLRKKSEATWARLTASNESVKNHRVWWEKQEQVERQDREEREREEKAERAAKAKEAQEKQQAEEAKRAADEAEEREKERAARVERRAAQKPLLDAALAAVDELLGGADGVSGGAGASPLSVQKTAVVEAATALLQHESIAQGDNETAVAMAEQLTSAVVTLRSTGFAELTKDALDGAVQQLKDFLESHVEPAPAVVKKGKKKRKKKAAAAKST